MIVKDNALNLTPLDLLKQILYLLPDYNYWRILMRNKSQET